MTYAKNANKTYIFPPEPGSPEAALHKPFSWLVPELQHDPDAQFSSVTKNFSFGIRNCLRMIHATDLASGVYADPAHPPLLSTDVREELMLFSIDAADELGEKAARDIERRNEKYLKERR
ncbi:hypothetical protein [Paraherbaspirillum soli]|uniref:Uncharacterized protein n=1 Tax=Paraherbaspirillum soli TaxID=631222 RepID=A0ABW0MAZ3_9BURK